MQVFMDIPELNKVQKDKWEQKSQPANRKNFNKLLVGENGNEHPVAKLNRVKPA